MRHIALLCLTAIMTFGEWSNDPAQPLDLGSGTHPQLAATPDGGLYIAWLSEGNFHIYLQRLDADGVPQWADGGHLVSSQPNNTWIAVFHMNLAVDADGNAIISTVDTRTGNWEVYVYKIAPDGSALWGADGLTLSSSGGDNISPRMVVVPDDNSVVVTWSRDFSSLRLQRISPAGDLQWGTDGIGISELVGDLVSPQPIIPDSGTVLVQWIRQTGTFPALNSVIRARRYDLEGLAQGPAASLHPAVGFPLGNWAQDCEADQIGGNYSSWTELTGTVQTGKVQHLDENGDLTWAAPVEVSTQSAHFRISPRLVTVDGNQDVYAVWNESDASQANRGIYAQMINSSGIRQWGNSGTAIEALGPDIYLDLNVSKMGENLVAAYTRENNFGTANVFASALGADANFMWDGEIVPVTTSGASKSDLIITDGPGCIFLSWSESGSIRAHCLLADGSLGAPGQSPGELIHVPGDYLRIQEAIDMAADGDTILVQPGIYRENLDFSGKDVTLGSLVLIAGDTSVISQTVIDGNGEGCVVVFENGESFDASLEGFTIQNGIGHYADPDGDGDSSSYGGGIYIWNASPRLLNLKVVNNSVSGGGGGGIFFHGSNTILEDILIAGNVSNDVGGGIYARGNSDLVISHSSFLNNLCEDVGGALYARDGSDLILRRVLVSGNVSDHAGGGIGFKNDCHPVLSFVTIADNQAAHYGGSIYSNHSFPVVVNSILWGNLGGEVYFASFDEPSEITLAYTDIQGGILGINTSDNGTVTWLEGNLDQEPAFTDPASGDYTLTLNSPCVDAGTALFTLNAETLVELGPDDFLGEAPDMGVHESEPDTLFYFPLVLGRQWNYDSGFDTMRLTIIDSLLIDGLAYHRFDGWFSGEDFDTFRVEGNQTLVRLGSTDHVLYDYGASLGESWVFPHPPEGLSTITLIGIGDILVTPADTYAECYVFHRNIGADYEFVEWFAPEIGLVQRDVITFTGLHRYYLIGIENTVAYDFSGVSRPLEYQISSIYPNPFNPVTTIEYTLARKGQHTLKVYNLQGALVATLIDENRPASNYSFTWDAGAYPSGLYILQLEAGADLQTRKLLLIK